MDRLNFIDIDLDIPILCYVRVDDKKIKLNELLCMHLNCQNFIKKFDGILKFLDFILEVPDVLAVTEMWVKADMLSCANITGFTFFYKSRGDRIGGGVGLYVNDGYTGDVVEVGLNFTSFEYLVVKSILNSNNIALLLYL